MSSENLTPLPACDTVSNGSRSERHSNSLYIIGNVNSSITIIGILANLLNIIVLVRLIKRRHSSTSYHILLALGVSDLLALFFYSLFSLTAYSRYPPILFNDLGEEHSNFQHIILYCWYFPVNVFTTASNWCVVSFTGFRFLGVIKPLKVGHWCTLRRTRLAIVLIYISTFLVSWPDWMTISLTQYPNGTIRGTDTPFYDSYNFKVYTHFYQSVQIFIPFVLNLVMVVVIVRNLYSTRLALSQSLTHKSVHAREKEHRHIAFMLVTIVLVFLICYIPRIAYNVRRDYTSSSRKCIEEAESMQVHSSMGDLFVLFNQSANVFLFCLVNKSYRRNMLTTLRCGKSLRSQSTRATLTTSLAARSTKAVVHSREGTPMLQSHQNHIKSAKSPSFV